jgi:hypothetical protein
MMHQGRDESPGVVICCVSLLAGDGREFFMLEHADVVGQRSQAIEGKM